MSQNAGIGNEETKKPDLIKVRERLKQALLRMKEDSCTIHEKLCQISDFREEPSQKICNVDDSLKPKSLTIVNELNDLLRDMESYNNILNEAKVGLIGIIG